MQIIERLLSRFGIGRLGASSTAMALGMAARGGILAAYLVLTTRWLGLAEYGAFSGAVAVVMLLASLAGWGANQVVTQRVAVKPTQLSRYWSASIVQIAFIGALLLAAVSTFPVIFPAERGFAVATLLFVGMAEFVALPLALNAASGLLAVGRSEAAAVAICLVPLGRLFALCAALAVGIPGSVVAMSALHLAGSILGSLAAIACIRSAMGGARRGRRMPVRRMLRAGTRYAAGNVVGSAYLEVDKVLVLAVLGSQTLGSYMAAFRAATLLALPVTALMSAALPRLFAQRQPAGQVRTLQAVLATAAGYGLLASAVVAIASPFLPMLFGPGFSDASGYLLQLAAWPLLFSIRQALSTGLTATGRQGERVVVEGLGLLLLVIGCSLFLGSYGVSAAIASLLGSELFVLAACAWRLSLSRGAREKQSQDSAGGAE